LCLCGVCPHAPSFIQIESVIIRVQSSQSQGQSKAETDGMNQIWNKLANLNGFQAKAAPNAGVVQQYPFAWW